MKLYSRIASHPAVRSAAGYAGLTSVVKAVAFVKEAVVAATFGVSGLMDAYLLGFLIVSFPVALLTNALQPVYIREFMRVTAADGEEAAAALLRRSLWRLLAVLLALFAVWAVALPWILELVAHGMDAERRRLVEFTVYGLTLYYFAFGANLLGYSTLQAQKRFTRGALVPVVTPLAIMLVVLAAGPTLEALIGAVTAGTLLETLLVYGGLRFGKRPRDAADAAIAGAAARRVASGTATLLPGTAAAGLAPIIEQSIAGGIGPGAIASLGYAGKLPATISSLLVTAVGTTILPLFTEMLERRPVADCRRFFLRYAALLAVGGAAIAAVGIAASEPFVRLAFERGAFTPEDTARVTDIQQAYLLQIPGALVGIAAVKVIAARGAFRRLAAANVLMVPVVGVAQWYFAGRWGAPGVALGTSFGATLTAAAFVAIALGTLREERR
jgi:putative peptidoglycan lipid II flippase